MGTVTPNVAEAVKNAKAGQVRYRNDKNGIIHTTIGKVDFNEAQLKEKLRSSAGCAEKAKPSSAKGVYIKKVSHCSPLWVQVLLLIKQASATV